MVGSQIVVTTSSLQNEEIEDFGRVETCQVKYPKNVEILIKIIKGRGRPMYFIVKKGEREAQRITVTLSSRVSGNVEESLIERFDSELMLFFGRKVLITDDGEVLMYHEVTKKRNCCNRNGRKKSRTRA